MKRERKQLDVLFGHIGALRYLLSNEYLNDKEKHEKIMGRKFTLEKFRKILIEELERTEKELKKIWEVTCDE